MSPAPRVSGLAKQALALHRALLRAARDKTLDARASICARIRAEFERHRAIDPRDASCPSSIAAPRTQAARAPPRPRREGPRAIASTRRPSIEQKRVHGRCAYISHVYTYTDGRTRRRRRQGPLIRARRRPPRARRLRALGSHRVLPRPHAGGRREHPRPVTRLLRHRESGRLVTRPSSATVTVTVFSARAPSTAGLGASCDVVGRRRRRRRRIPASFANLRLSSRRPP